MLKMTAMLREIPPDHKGGHTLARDEITTTADTYETALKHLHRNLPDQWQIIGLRVDR